MQWHGLNEDREIFIFILQLYRARKMRRVVVVETKVSCQWK